MSDHTTQLPGAAPTADGGRTSRWRRRLVLAAGALLGALGVGYLLLLLTVGSDLARNATVLGVPVGGMSAAAAEEKLTREILPPADEPLEVRVSEQSYEVVPSQAGLGVDVSATVAAIPGGSANPLALVRALLAGGPVDPVPTVERADLEEAIGGIAEQADVPPVNGSVGFTEGEVVTSGAEAGSAVDIAATADLVEAAYFGSEGPHDLPLEPVAAEVDVVRPDVTDAEVERAVTEFAEPAMSGPVTIEADAHEIEVTPEMVSTALTMGPDDSGTLVPSLDQAQLYDAAREALEEVGEPARDATMRIEDDTAVVVPAETGVGIAPEALANGVLSALPATDPASRRASVEFSEVEPELTTEEVETLQVTEVIGEFTTQFPYSAYRNTNIGLAAEHIDDTLLLPGDTFSLNGLVGERTAANGFAVGWTISGGRLVEAYGGGVSQVATTAYHAAFVAGLEDVYHKPHSIYFDRYPVAAEATVSWGNFDMSFKNDTPHGVLVDTEFSPSSSGSLGVLTVKIWSKPYFEVETSLSDRSDYTEPETIHDSSDACSPQQGWEGFSITSYRQVWNPDGELVKDESYPWTYRPNPTVVCTEESSDES